MAATSPQTAYLQNFPAALPPPGTTANFRDPESRSYQAYAAVAVCMPVLLIAVGVRVYVKAFIVKKKTWDDLLCVLGLAGAITYFGLIMGILSKGSFGSHQWDLRFSVYSNQQFLLLLIIEAIYSPFIFIIKLALFLFLLEIFGRLKWLRYLAWFGIVITGLFYASCFTGYFVLCYPRPGQTFLDAQLDHKCSGQSMNLLQAAAIGNLISDLYILVIPIPAILSLHMPLRKKLGVTAIFGTGLMACISSAVGLYWRYKITNSIDQTWELVPTLIVIITEMTAGLLVLCMPAFAALFHHYQTPIKSFLSKYSKMPKSPAHSRHFSQVSQEALYLRCPHCRHWSPSKEVGWSKESMESSSRHTSA